MSRHAPPALLDLAAIRTALLELSDAADTPAVGRVLLQAYELTLVAEQSLNPTTAPFSPRWYDSDFPKAGGEFS